MAEPFLSEIRIFSFGFAPKGWALCNGQLLPINQNQALFSLLGTMYGGDGRVNFALPDLRGRTSVHVGSQFNSEGQRGGEESHTINISELPVHTHFLKGDAATAATSNVNLPTTSTVLGQSIGKPSSGSTFPVDIYNSTLNPLTAANPAMIGATGGSQPHENRQPFLALTFAIALQGIFPSRN
jgi:microcystin-dependent protein